jgi:hypothetical protein
MIRRRRRRPIAAPVILDPALGLSRLPGERAHRCSCCAVDLFEDGAEVGGPAYLLRHDTPQGVCIWLYCEDCRQRIVTLINPGEVS